MVYVSNAYGTFPARGTIVVDRAGIVGAGTLNFIEYFEFQNQSTNPVYIEVEIRDTTGNWTFSDGTTKRRLGSVEAGTTQGFTLNFKRPEPTTDVEGEVFNLIVRVYQDSTYTTLQYEYTWPVDVYIVDFKNNANWTVHQVWNWDDGSSQGWSGGIPDSRFSIQAGGYSYRVGNDKNGTRIMTQSGYQLPTASRIFLVGYFALDLYSVDHYVKDLKVLFGGQTVFQALGTLVKYDSGEPRYQGWFQFGANLSDFSGSVGDLQIQLFTTAYVYAYFDELMIVYRP